MGGAAGVRGAGRKPSTGEELEGAIPGEARRAEINRINAPWLVDPDKLQSGRPDFPPQMFANPAMRGAAVGLAPTAAPRPPDLQPSARPRVGIKHAVLVDDLPKDTRCLTDRTLRVGPYKLYPEVREEGGQQRVVYWTAYNTKERRVDYVIGPSALKSFERATSDYERAADTTFSQGAPDEVTKQSLLVVERGVREGFGAALRQLGPAWRAALTDPKWVARTAADVFIAIGGSVPARRTLTAAEARAAAAARARAPASAEARAAGAAEQRATRGAAHGDPPHGAARVPTCRPGNTERSIEGISLHGYVDNANRVTRTPAEALDLAKKHNVRVPEFVRIVVDPTVPKESFAEYRLGRGVRLDPSKPVTWRDLAPDGSVTVRVHPDVMKSDEAIVAVLAHESHELRNLKALIEEHELTPAQVQAHIRTDSDTNLHGQAWTIADLKTQLMRAETPEARASIQKRLEAIEAKYCERSGVCP